jgi:hypothetical protein
VKFNGGESGSRHRFNARLCDQLQRIAWGRSAANLLGERSRRPQAVVTLPTWIWLTPASNVGRKAKSRDGGLLRLPLAVSWDVEPVLTVTADQPVVGHWTANGMGHSLSGKTEVCAVSTRTAPRDLGEPALDVIPDRLEVPTLARPHVRSRLGELVADGRMAQWDVLGDFEQYLDHAFAKAHSAVSAELRPLSPRPVLDASDQEMLRTSLLLGDVGSGDSAVLRLINRCLEPNRFTRVDPERYVVTALFSAAETAIRRKLGDPHIGRKVRRFAATRRFETVDDLIAEYREVFPKDRLSVKRACSALETTRSIPALVPLPPE